MNIFFLQDMCLMHLMQLLDPMRWRNLCYCLRTVWRAVLLSRNMNNYTGKIQNLRHSNRKRRKTNRKIDIGIYRRVNKNFQFDYIVKLIKNLHIEKQQNDNISE